MRILHTSDWHVGKRLGRFDRLAEHRAAVAEVAAIAEQEDVDLAVHSGDVFDRASPSTEALTAGLEGLVELTAEGSRPVVAVAGNHDSPELFEALAPYLRPWGVHLVGRIKPPAEGGVLRFDTEGGTALVACFPFLREGRVVDFMADSGAWYGQYADRVRSLSEHYAHYLASEGAGAVTVLAAHFLVSGVRFDTAARGERSLHMGEAYTAQPAAIPSALSYVAMGHFHGPQPVPGAQVPAEYAGSLLQLDFGEAGERKRVVVVDAEPEVPAQVRSVELSAGTPLLAVEGTWEEISSRADLADTYLDLRVRTAGPDPELDAIAREAFPLAVKVRAQFERPDRERHNYRNRPLDEVYADYHLQAHGEKATGELLTTFRAVADEVEHAPT